MKGDQGQVIGTTKSRWEGKIDIDVRYIWKIAESQNRVGNIHEELAPTTWNQDDI
jgi:hypothetical protein